MTEREAVEVLGVLREAAIPSDWSKDRSRLAIVHLTRLPFKFAMKNARLWATMPKVDASGREVPKHLTSLTEVLSAVGVLTGARADLARAVEEQGELMVDLRSPNELTYVGPRDPIPQGCVEYLRLNELPVPARPVRPALVAPGSDRAETSRSSGGRSLVSILGDRGRERRPAVRRPPPVVEVADLLLQLDNRPDVPRELAEAVRRLAYRLGGQVAALEEQRQVHEERVLELEDAYTGDHPDLEGLLEGLRRLSARVRQQHRGALSAVLETVAAAFAPELNDVRVRAEPSDPLDDRSPPRRVLVDLRRAEEPAPTPSTPRDTTPTRLPRRFGDLTPRS